jgi:hypothetical protein
MQINALKFFKMKIRGVAQDNPDNAPSSSAKRFRENV